MNRPTINKGKECVLAAGMNIKVPNAEIINPRAMPFL
jgi:hypothetical protein